MYGVIAKPTEEVINFLVNNLSLDLIYISENRIFTSSKDDATNEKIFQENDYFKKNPDCESASISKLMRKLTKEDIDKIYSETKDASLKKILEEYYETKELILSILDNAKLRQTDFSWLINSQPAEIYKWINLKSKPESLKMQLFRYWADLGKDIVNDEFYKFLKNKGDSNMYKVIVKNNTTKARLNSFEQTFDNPNDAENYYSKIIKSKQLEGLDVSLSILSNKDTLKNHKF